MALPPRVIVLDLIGTTFSLEPLRDALVHLGLPTYTLDLWFARALRDTFAIAAAGTFSPFRSVLEGALRSVVPAGRRLSDEERQGLLDRFKSLPAHPDAAEALQVFRSAGIRVFALSNGAAPTSQELLRNSNLDPFVEQVVSVDEIGTFKPRREVYLHAAKLAGVAPGEMALLATHAWDVHGAKAAGLMAAFVARGQIFPDSMHAPDASGDTMKETARALVT